MVLLTRLALGLLFVAPPALVVVLPSAHACSWIGQPDNGQLAWPNETTWITNVGYTLATLDDRDGLEAVVDAFPGFAFALDPGGRYLVFASGDTTQSPHGVADSCSLGYGATEALALETGERTLLFAGASRGIAAEPGGVAVLEPDREHLRRYAWGQWDTHTRTALELDGRAGRFVSSPDGARSLFLVHGEAGTSLALLSRDGTRLASVPVEDRVVGLAFAPDGASVAMLSDARSGAVLTVRAGSDLGVVAERTLGAAPPLSIEPTGLLWDADGLLTVSESTLHVFPAAGDLSNPRDVPLSGEATGGLARSPDGSLLAVGTEDAVVLLDGQLREMGRLRSNGEVLTGEPLPPPSTEPPRAKRATPWLGLGALLTGLAAIALVRREGP